MITLTPEGFLYNCVRIYLLQWARCYFPWHLCEFCNDRVSRLKRCKLQKGCRLFPLHSDSGLDVSSSLTQAGQSLSHQSRAPWPTKPDLLLGLGLCYKVFKNNFLKPGFEQLSWICGWTAAFQYKIVLPLLWIFLFNKAGFKPGLASADGKASAAWKVFSTDSLSPVFFHAELIH